MWRNRSAGLQSAIANSAVQALGQKTVDSILQDLVLASANDPQIRQLLAQHGYVVNSSAPAPGSAPTNSPPKPEAP